MEYFKFVSHVVEKELRNFNLDMPVYVKLVPELKSTFDGNFLSAYNRCVFMYRYATSFLYFTELLIHEFFSSFLDINSVSASWEEKKILSLSFGPCLDYLALQKAILELSGSTVHFGSVHVSTKFGTWKNTFKYIVEALQEGDVSQLSALPLDNIEFSQNSDVLLVSSDILANSDLILMIKTLNLLVASESDDNELLNRLKEIVSKMKPDGEIMFFDSRLSANVMLEVLSVFPGSFLFEPKHCKNMRINLNLPETYKKIHGEFPIVTTRGVFFVWKKDQSYVGQWTSTPRFIPGISYDRQRLISIGHAEIGLSKSEVCDKDSLNSSQTSLTSINSDSSHHSKKLPSQISLKSLKETLNCDKQTSSTNNKNNSEVLGNYVLNAVDSVPSSEVNKTLCIKEECGKKSEDNIITIIPNVLDSKNIHLIKKSGTSQQSSNNSGKCKTKNDANQTFVKKVQSQEQIITVQDHVNKPSGTSQQSSNNSGKCKTKNYANQIFVKKMQLQEQLITVQDPVNKQSSISLLTNKIKQIVSTLEKDISKPNSSNASCASCENMCQLNGETLNGEIKSSSPKSGKNVFCTNCPQANELQCDTSYTCECGPVQLKLNCTGGQNCSNIPDRKACRNVHYCSSEITNIQHKSMCCKCHNFFSTVQSCHQNLPCHTCNSFCLHQKTLPSCSGQNPPSSCMINHSCCGNQLMCGCSPHMYLQNSHSSSCRKPYKCISDGPKSDISAPSIIIPLDGIDLGALMQMISSLKLDSKSKNDSGN